MRGREGCMRVKTCTQDTKEGNVAAHCEDLEGNQQEEGSRRGEMPKTYQSRPAVCTSRQTQDAYSIQIYCTRIEGGMKKIKPAVGNHCQTQDTHTLLSKFSATVDTGRVGYALCWSNSSHLLDIARFIRLRSVGSW